MNGLGGLGLQQKSSTPHFGSENTMKGINTLANDIRRFEEEVAEWKKEYDKLQVVCNVLVQKLECFMEVDEVKNLIRELGIKV